MMKKMYIYHSLLIMNILNLKSMNSEQYLAGKFFHIQNPVGSVIYFISTYHYSEINFKLNN